MKAATRILFLDDNNDKFFGEGPYMLLKKVEETGSLRSAAISMGMSYSKAMKLLKRAEKALGYPLTLRQVGGKSGGGSILTPECKAWIEKYEAYRDECIKANEVIYGKYFDV